MMHGNNQKSVTVNRVKLIEQLKLNMAQHKGDYNEAVIGYRIKLMDDLALKLGEIQGLSAEEVLVVKTVSFAPPVSYEKEYIDAITMLEWSVSDTIDLDQTTFKQYIQNEWTWTRGFDVMNSTYKAFAGSVGAAR